MTCPTAPPVQPDHKRPYRHLVLLGGILVVSLCLRLIGIFWGIPTADFPHRAFHPDEEPAMLGLAAIGATDKASDLQYVYLEGSFNYYLWNAGVACLRPLGIVDKPLNGRVYDQTFRTVLSFCRFVTAIIDTVGVMVIFLALRQMQVSISGALFGAAAYGFLPFEIIYAHYMRPHVLANLFCCLVFYISIGAVQKPAWWKWMLAGVLAGLGMATRYTTGIILAIPFLYFITWRVALHDGRNFWRKAVSSVLALLGGPAWLMLAGLLAGLFIGIPSLFLDTASVLTWASRQSAYIPQGAFTLGNLLNLGAISAYITYLIPHGYGPGAWLLPYAAVAAALFLPKHYRYTLPIIVFSMLYLYPMAKGYSKPVFVRAALLLFPGFSLLTGWLFDRIRELRFHNPIFEGGKYLPPGILLLLSLVFSTGYVVSMRHPDPRVQLYEYFQPRVQEGKTVFAAPQTFYSYFNIRPGLELLPASHASLVFLPWNGPNAPANYYITSRLNTRNQKLEKAIKKSRNFVSEATFKNVLKIGPLEWDISRYPDDMNYPFSQIDVFRSLNGRLKASRRSASSAR